MKGIVLLLMLACSVSFAKEKGQAEITYVGMGRYTCKGNSYQCAQINANNRALEDRERAKDDARRAQERERFERDLELYKDHRR